MVECKGSYVDHYYTKQQAVVRLAEVIRLAYQHDVDCRPGSWSLLCYRFYRPLNRWDSSRWSIFCFLFVFLQDSPIHASDAVQKILASKQPICDKIPLVRSLSGSDCYAARSTTNNLLICFLVHDDIDFGPRLLWLTSASDGPKFNTLYHFKS